MRLDQERLDVLRRWGQALREADGEERAAAGRAVLMLIEEIERLRLELERTREQTRREEHREILEQPSSVSSTLQQRLYRVLRREPESSDASPATVGHEEPIGEHDGTTSPQAWIESLRRQP